LSRFPRQIKEISASTYAISIVTTEKKCYGWGRNEFYELSYQGVAKIEKAKPLKPRIDPAWKKKQKEQFSNANSAVGSLQDLDLVDFKRPTNTLKYVSKPDIDAKSQKLDFLSMKSVRNCSFYLTEQVPKSLTKGIFSVGNALTGLLGYGQRFPGEIQNIAYLIELPSVHKVKGLATNRSSCFAWTEAGETFAWGSNEGGLLGVREAFRRPGLVQHPERVGSGDQVELMAGSRVVGVFPGESCVFAVSFQGKAFYWGQ
jgi:alpha-tubulin suppressor-like RCC1 family protein